MDVVSESDESGGKEFLSYWVAIHSKIRMLYRDTGKEGRRKNF
jgi:hypothetical protein